MASSSISRLFISTLLGFSLTGCGLIGGLNDKFADDGSVIGVFVTHHATPQGGMFPPRNGPPAFVTDMGWEVLLDDAVVGLVGATFNECVSDGNSRELDLYWGPLPEDLDLQDLDTIRVGGVELSSGQWCGVNVQYGPITASETDHDMPVPAASGTTLYLRGLAQKDGAMVPFEVSVNEPVSVLISMSEIDGGGPLNVTDIPGVNVTISKNYDRFFQGVDFNNFTNEELQDLSLASLAAETKVSLGTVVQP